MGKEDLLMITQGVLNMAGVVSMMYLRIPVEQIITILGALNSLSVAKHVIDIRNGKTSKEVEERLAKLEEAVAHILDRV